MKTRAILFAGVGLLLLAGLSFSQTKPRKQKLGEMTTSALRPAMAIPPPDSTVLIVRSTIRNLELISNLGERVQKVGEGVWYMYLAAESQKISFKAEDYKLLTQEYRTLEKNRVYEIQISPKKSKPWLWVGLGVGAAGGAVAILAGSGKGGGTPTPPNEKLPDPPGNPTGN